MGLWRKQKVRSLEGTCCASYQATLSLRFLLSHSECHSQDKCRLLSVISNQGVSHFGLKTSTLPPPFPCRLLLLRLIRRRAVRRSKLRKAQELAITTGGGAAKGGDPSAWGRAAPGGGGGGAAAASRGGRQWQEPRLPG